MYSLQTIAQAMNTLDMVTWDRCVVRGSRGTVYGWITRPDGRLDFAVLYWNSASVGYTTSSAEWSREIGRRLGLDGSTHQDCERVEDVFGAQVSRSMSPPASDAPAEQAGPHVVDGKVRPHPSHEWREDRPQTRCVRCGAYRHLSSGFFTCPAPPPPGEGDPPPAPPGLFDHPPGAGNDAAKYLGGA